MNAKTVVPWIIAAASVAFAVSSSAPQPAVVPTPEQAAAAHPVLVASARPVVHAGMDAETMREIVREVMRAELPEAAGTAAAIAEPAEADLEAMDDGLVLVDDLIDVGHITHEDVMDIRLAISQMDRAEGEVVLSAYFDALNSGEIVIEGSPL